MLIYIAAAIDKIAAVFSFILIFFVETRHGLSLQYINLLICRQLRRNIVDEEISHGNIEAPKLDS